MVDDPRSKRRRHGQQQVNHHGTARKPRTSIRDVPHAWDADRAPVTEIQRIRTRARQLRNNRSISETENLSTTIISDASDCEDEGESAMDLLPLAGEAAQFGTIGEGDDDESSSSRTPQAGIFSSSPFHSIISGSNRSSPAPLMQSNNSKNNSLSLHDICGEASKPEDWRRAIKVLAARPHLASVPDPTQHDWLPLHISCLSGQPPAWWIRALLFVHSAAASTPDASGRLPLQLAAASPACSVEALLVPLVEAFPEACSYCFDTIGYTALVLLLRNRAVQVTVRHVQVVLGMLDAGTSSDLGGVQGDGSGAILQRRQEHWDLASHDRLLQAKQPVTTNFLNHAAVSNEAWFARAPHDVQVSLRKLAQWKKQQSSALLHQRSKAASSNFANTKSPASISTPTGQYPIHILVQRAIIDPAPLNIPESLLEEEKKEGDDDDETAAREQEALPSVVEAPSILRILAAAAPEALVIPNGDGLTPLLQVIMEEETVPDMEDISEILLGGNTTSSSHDDRAVATTPAMVSHQTTGQLPLHFAAASHTTKIPLLRSLVRAYPRAITVPDPTSRRTPLHLALRAFRRQPPLDARVLELLYADDDSVATLADDYGNRPVDVLLQTRIPRSSQASSPVYQRLLLAAAQDEQHAVPIRSFRRLPPWLRAQACAAPAVQEQLVEDMAQPWKCALILGDGVLLVAVLVLFRIQLQAFMTSENSMNGVWSTYALYATAVLRLCLQLLLGVVAANLGELRHLCLANGWFWVDMGAMIMSIVTSVVLYGNTSEERVVGMATATTCMLWLALLGYLSNWWYGMSIFVGGFLRIAERLLYPTLCCCMLVVGFAQCFYTLLQFDCAATVSGAAECTGTERNAYQVVYRLMRGASVLSANDGVEFSYDAMLLTTAMLVLLAAFVIALCVTVLISSKHLDVQAISIHTYWEKKLALIVSLADFGFHAKQSFSAHETCFPTRSLERCWSRLSGAVTGNDSSCESHDLIKGAQSRTKDVVFALVVLPLWIMAGVLTLGALWPPQVRRWLFRPPSGFSAIPRGTAEASTDRTHLQELRSEVSQVKRMSSEKSRFVEDELQELKRLIVSALK